MNYGFHTYQKNNKTVVSPMTHVLALYKDAIEHLEKALEAHRAEDFETRFYECERARRIVNGLQESLYRGTPEAEDMSKTFDAFYASVRAMILYTNTRNDEKYCLQAIDSLKTLRDSLSYAESAYREQQMASQPSPQNAVSASQPSVNYSPQA